MAAESVTAASYAVIVAAGSGRRCPGPRAKQFLELDGRPLYLWSVAAFAAVERIRGIVLVGPPDDEAARAEMGRATREVGKLMAVVAGGSTRTESVARGLKALERQTVIPAAAPILIHDGARPLVTPELIDRVIDKTSPTQVAIPVTAPTATVKQLNGESIRASIPRESVGLAQTPQGVACDLLRRALGHHFASPPDERQATDEGSLIEALPADQRRNLSVVAVPGDRCNLKITFPEDLEVAQALLSRTPAPPAGDPPALATGFGYDVHAFAAGRRLVLGGIEISGHAGLAGHSDADVLIHALVDAILGAIGEGDIGRLFPDHDPAYKDISSLFFLEKAVARVREKGRKILAADVTVVAQAPKLAPHIPAMQECLLTVLGPCQLNLKATTSEGLGFAGRREGIAAYAVVTVAAS